MNIAITGGNGFIGRRLLAALAGRGHELKVLSRRAGSLPDSTGVSTVRGDLTSNDCPLDRLMDGCEVIFNCAGEIRTAEAMRPLHVDGTRRLLQAVQTEAARRGRPIHWVQLSSVGAYGPPSRANAERVITEDSPAHPVGEYEITKTLSDDLVVQAATSGLMTCTIVRPSNVFGANMPNGSLRALGAMVRKRLFFYIGNAGAVAPYVHVEDVAELLRLCGSDERARGRIYNLSNDCLLSEMIEGMAASLGVKPPARRLPETFVRLAVRLASVVVRVPLTQERIDALVARTRYPFRRAERELGFVPRRSVPASIGEVVSK